MPGLDLDQTAPSGSTLPVEPAHEIMVLLVLRKLILQMRMPGHSVGLDV